MKYEQLEEKQKDWVDKHASLPFDKWFEVFLQLKKQGKYPIIGLIAEKRLRSMGFVKLAQGSCWNWMEKTWFEQARDEEVITYIPAMPTEDYNGNVLPGCWVPSYEEKEEQVEVGKRGNRSIYESRTTKDYSKFINFENRYYAWKQHNTHTGKVSKQQLQEAITF